MQEPISAEAAASQHWPSAPVYDLGQNPTSSISLDAREFEGEVKGNFWRSARWCMDGSSVATTTEDRTIRIHTVNDDYSFGTRAFQQPDAIHSTSWYPSATLSTPVTFCFVASIRDTPVRLIDGTDGRVRASYPIIDHRERFVAPHSLAFNHTGTKLYCGCENSIEVFDISSPGYDQGERLKLIYAKKEKGGQKGIISALSFCPDYSGTFAAGTYSSSSSVSLYSEDTGSTPLAHVEGLVGGGVTQIGWHPLNPTIMFISSRRSSNIQIYDTRDLSAPFSSFERCSPTNQRVGFDVDPWGRWLTSGDETGTVRIWDITTMDTKPIFEEKLHQDAVGSVQFHPFQPLLLTCSGSRKHLQNEHEDDDEYSSSESEEESEDESGSEDRGHSNVKKGCSRPIDATLRVWSMNGQAEQDTTNNDLSTAPA